MTQTINHHWRISAVQPCAAFMVCRTCGELKAQTDFSKRNRPSKNRVNILGEGKVSQCKTCQNNAYVQLDPRIKMLYAARSRAKKAEIEFNLTIEDIVIPEICPVLGIPLFARVNGGKVPPTLLANSPSLDRIDNTKGYIRGNVQVISMRANNLKADGTLEEMEAIVAYMKTCRLSTKSA